MFEVNMNIVNKLFLRQGLLVAFIVELLSMQ